ncbi:mucin-2 protein [Nocardioides sp.]|uniref:mucin-2 protein n=1 Tax=Nocardioides sp. TaxID=35761 RepID=UPI002630EAFC|nr:mucin-2 protein [Nocardioides sp.]
MAAPAATVATVAVVGVGVATSGSSTQIAADQVAATTDATASASAANAAATDDAQSTAASAVEQRKRSLSRSLSRRMSAAASAEATSTAVTRWTTTALNIWTSPADSATQDGEVASGEKIKSTGRVVNSRVEVVIDGEVRWVSEGYLATDKPDPVLNSAPCADTGVEKGLKPQTIALYRAVCHAFPEVTSYGGWAARTEHDTGNAIDVMVPGNKALGDKIAAWAQKNAAVLDLYDILWWHRIWTPVRSSEGWRTFADRGSATANHMDHVHLGTN